METNKNIDWEQRRYEIAKGMYVRVVDFPKTYTAKMDAKTSISFADALIEELQKPKQQDQYSRIVEQATELYKALQTIASYRFCLTHNPAEELNEVISISREALKKCLIDYPEIEE